MGRFMVCWVLKSQRIISRRNLPNTSWNSNKNASYPSCVTLIRMEASECSNDRDRPINGLPEIADHTTL